jgi:alcohol dehydrogenase class IV
MDDQKLAAYLVAHGSLLALLIEQVTKANPNFIADAQKEFDTFLGTKINKTSPIEDEVLVEARVQLVNILEAVKLPGPLNLPIPRTERTFLQRLFGR